MSVTKKDLNELQLEKLRVAAEMLMATAHLYNGNKSLLPLWGAGVITHGIPKVKKCEIGITVAAKNAKKEDITKDHLYRVTETARIILEKIQTNQLSILQIEEMLLDRSAQMITTRNENHKQLKDALKLCINQDSWEELYHKANIKYELYN